MNENDLIAQIRDRHFTDESGDVHRDLKMPCEVCRLLNALTADHPVTEPRTEAGKQLAARAKRESWSNWEGLTQFTIPAIEAEAAQGTAPRSVERAEQGQVSSDER